MKANGLKHALNHLCHHRWKDLRKAKKGEKNKEDWKSHLTSLVLKIIFIKGLLAIGIKEKESNGNRDKVGNTCPNIQGIEFLRYLTWIFSERACYGQSKEDFPQDGYQGHYQEINGKCPGIPSYIFFRV